MRPFDLLGLPADATPEQVRSAWRALAQTVHPDKGGDVERFYVLEQAYRRALALASEPKPCSNCLGTGRVVVQRGFARVDLACPTCMVAKT